MYTLHRSPADHTRGLTSLYYCHPKKFSVLPPDGFFVLPPDGFVFDLGISTNKGRVSTRSGKSRNLLKDQENSGKFDIFLKKVREKSGKKIFIHANF